MTYSQDFWSGHIAALVDMLALLQRMRAAEQARAKPEPVCANPRPARARGAMPKF